MKRNLLIYSLVASFALFASCTKNTNPQYTQQNEEPSGELSPFPAFNPKSVTSFKGQVVSVIRLDYIDRPGYDVLLMVRTDEGDIPVQLGPGSFVESGPIQLQPLDQIEVKGSQLYIEGGKIVIAQEIKKGNFSLKLRDKEGNPLWSGWRQN